MRAQFVLGRAGAKTPDLRRDSCDTCSWNRLEGTKDVGITALCRRGKAMITPIKGYIGSSNKLVGYMMLSKI